MAHYLKLDEQVLGAVKAYYNALTAGKPHQVLAHPDQGVYLERWKSLQEDGSGYYAHLMHRSDADDELHDHPFDNTTILLEGAWVEHLPGGATRSASPGDCIIRQAHEEHRIEIIDGPTKSLFWRGPKIREWGFHTTEGWVHNQTFFRQRGYF